MTDVLNLACAASDRRSAASQSRVCGIGADREVAASASQDSAGPGLPDRSGRSLPGSAASLDWQLPLPPVRFPLRDALLSFGDGHAVSGQEAAAQGAVLAIKPPLKVCQTQKTRAIREIGRLRRNGQIHTGLIEERPQPIPTAPAEADRPKTPPKAVSSLATNTRQSRIRQAQEAGLQWPVMEESRSAPSLGSTAGGSPTGGGGGAQFRETWTSAARTVLGHSRRFPGSAAPTGEGGQGTLEDAGSRWPGAALQSYRHLPRPVREWANRGLEFTDRGLGVGDRFDSEVVNRAKRAPGFIYEQTAPGNVALWSPTAASQPTKQPLAQHVSTEVHRMGGRWKDGPGPDKQMPAPGTYEIPGFVEEMQRKVARRPRGKAPREESGHHSSGPPAAAAAVATK